MKIIDHILIENKTGSPKETKIYAITEDGEKLAMKYVQVANINISSTELPKLNMEFFNFELDTKLEKTCKE